jgi:pimeloyl-ACP methyl ester carboxylesterase
MSKPNPNLASALDDGLDEILLHYTTSNPSGKSTILLIHGAFVSGFNWDLVVPHLTSYHLLLPDLPGHGQSRNITPFSVEPSSRLLAALIRKHGINGRAHIVGHSLGAHVAINLASSYSELVDALFISGFEIYPQAALSQFMPYAMWTENRIQKSHSPHTDKLADGWYRYPTWGSRDMHDGFVSSDYLAYDRNDVALPLALRGLLLLQLGRAVSSHQETIHMMLSNLWRLEESAIQGRLRSFIRQ